MTNPLFVPLNFNGSYEMLNFLYHPSNFRSILQQDASVHFTQAKSLKDFSLLFRPSYITLNLSDLKHFTHSLTLSWKILLYFARAAMISIGDRNCSRP